MLSLGWTSIPSIIRKGMSDGEASAIMLAENISRKDLDPVDEAMAYQKRIDLFGWEPAEIAKRCGVSLDRIRKRLKLTSVRPDILSMVRSGQFPTGHAEAISVLDHNRQMIAARPLISGQPINLRQFQVIVGQLLSEQQTESLFDISSFLQSPGSQSEISTQKVKVDAAKDLPIVRPNCGRHTGEVIYNYIQDLLRVGLTREAEVCGALLVGLDSSNFARIPVESKIETGIEILRNS
jgi:ParB family chromosome partitioning protein